MTAAHVDNRLIETPMTPVHCATCGAGVLARKSSWQQTSVQWNAEAVSRCHELDETTLRGPSLAGCERMREAIHSAAIDGKIPLPAETANA